MPSTPITPTSPGLPLMEAAKGVSLSLPREAAKSLNLPRVTRMSGQSAFKPDLPTVGSSTNLSQISSSLRPAGSSTRSQSGSPACCSRIKQRRSTRMSSVALLEQLEIYNSHIYLPGKKFKEEYVMGALSRTPCDVSSLVDHRMAEMIQRFGPDIRLYHRDNLSRVYPAGSHVDSSNYRPLVHWFYGVQMVALNFQTHDEGDLLNEALFRTLNGGVGYVLKPDCLRTNSDAVDRSINLGRECSQAFDKTQSAHEFKMLIRIGGSLLLP